MTDIRQGNLWAAFMEELGWEAAKITASGKNHFVYSRKIPLFGKILKAPRMSLPLPLSAIEDLAADNGAFFTKVEPNASLPNSQVLGSLKTLGYQNDRWSLHPTKTIVLDLRQKDDELLSGMEKDTRYSIRASQRRGIRVVKSSNLERFLKLYRATAARQGFWIPEKDLRTLWDIFSNEGHAFILIAVWNRTDIAGCLILHHEKTAYYYHAASLREYKEFFAPYLLIWESMLEAKRLGLRQLDLEGIYDHRFPATNKWKGFSHFKRGFRGEEVELLGSFVKNYNPILSTVYKVSNLSLNFR